MPDVAPKARPTMAVVSTIGARDDAGNVPHTGVACAFCARKDPDVAPKARPTMAAVSTTGARGKFVCRAKGATYHERLG